MDYDERTGHHRWLLQRLPKCSRPCLSYSQRSTWWQEWNLWNANQITSRLHRRFSSTFILHFVLSALVGQAFLLFLQHTKQVLSEPGPDLWSVPSLFPLPGVSFYKILLFLQNGLPWLTSSHSPSPPHSVLSSLEALLLLHITDLFIPVFSAKIWAPRWLMHPCSPRA